MSTASGRQQQQEELQNSVRTAASSSANTPQLSPGIDPQTASQPFYTSVKSGSVSATPRLLFTWDPYRHLTTGTVLDEGTPNEPQLAVSLGEVSNASSTANVTITQPNLHTLSSSTMTAGEVGSGGGGGTGRGSGGEQPSPVAAGVPARPPLTISSILSGMSSSHSTDYRSPHHSSNVAAAVVAAAGLDAGTPSAHSTPSAAVLKRIPTSAQDARQYFLDYSPTVSGTAAPGTVLLGMPNLMLPPNLSPNLRTADVHAQQQQQQHPPVEMEALDLDHHPSATTSPQVVPLMSAPRGSSTGGTASFSFNASASWNGMVGQGLYSTSSTSAGVTGAAPSKPQQQQLSYPFSTLGMAGGLLSPSLSSSTVHNPYRMSPSTHPITVTTTVVAPVQSVSLATTQQTQQHPQQQQQIADMDEDIFESLREEPSTFIRRLLPPPPPLPEVGRVLTDPQTLQTLCERWCALTAMALAAPAFHAITTAPPSAPTLPPSSPSPSSTIDEEPAADTASVLNTWYEEAAKWYESLDQSGAASVDIRAPSRAVAFAVEAAAGGRARRAPANNSNNGYSNKNYNNNGGRGRGGSALMRGRGNGYGFPGGRSGPRGGLGGKSAGFYAPNVTVPASFPASMEVTGGDRPSRGGGGYYGAGLNLYEESWGFSGKRGVEGEWFGAQQQQQRQPSYMVKGGRSGALPSSQARITGGN